jgi:hypothetical protein
MFRAVEVAQAVLTQRPQTECGTSLIDSEVSGRSRHQHLAAMADRTEASGANDGLSCVIAVIAKVSLTGVDRHPNSQRFGGRPGLGGERLLSGYSSRKRVRRPCERCHDRVALTLLLGSCPSMRGNNFGKDLVVADDG